MSDSPFPASEARPASTPTARLYLGTTQGLVALDLCKAGWRSGAVLWRDHAINALVVDPAAPERIHAAVAGEGLYRSEDAGQSWTRGLSARIHSLAQRPDRPELLYAGAEPPEVYRSPDSGGHWTALRMEAGTSGLLAPRSDWRRVPNLAFDPRNPAIVYAGVEGGGIVKTFDGGRAWIELAARGLPPEVQTLLAPTAPPETLLAGTPQGIFRSEDQGFEWTGDGAGLEEPDILALAETRGAILAAAHPTRAESGAAPGPARLYRKPAGSIRWWPVTERLDGAVHGFAGHPEQAAIYAGTTGGSLWSSRDGGQSWRRLARGLPPIQALALG